MCFSPVFARSDSWAGGKGKSFAACPQPKSDGQNCKLTLGQSQNQVRLSASLVIFISVLKSVHMQSTTLESSSNTNCWKSFWKERWGGWKVRQTLGVPDVPHLVGVNRQAGVPRRTSSPADPIHYTDCTNAGINDQRQTETPALTNSLISMTCGDSSGSLFSEMIFL